MKANSRKLMTIGKLNKMELLQKSRFSRSSGCLVLFEMLALLLLLLLLVLADILCYQQALSVVLDEQAGHATLSVGSETVPLGFIGDPVSLQFPLHDPVIHEYQLDGTDSTDNFTLDTTYLHSIASSPYYLFQSWMRNLDGTSRWSDLRVSSNSLLLASKDWPANGESVSLLPATRPSSSATLRLQVMLRRPETPMTLNLIMADNSIIQITLDRNDRTINVMRGSHAIANAFFPVDVLPFTAMVIDTLLRTIAWAVVLLMVVLVCEVALVFIRYLWLPPSRALPEAPVQEERAQIVPGTVESSPSTTNISPFASLVDICWMAFIKVWRNLTRALHPIVLVVLLASLCFVAWIASVQYHAEPHIYDASAYLFAAKMYASGHLAVPALAVLDRFPGPFMVQYGGQWFGQYVPGTSLTLVPGIWLGVPWLVEPVLGTFALLGIGLIAARLFDRRVATLAVLLGTLSPFYSYLAASYLSHTVALFYLTWGLWALLRFSQGEARWNLPLAALFFGMGYLTRDLPALLFVAVVLPSIMLLSWRRVRDDWRNWIMPGIFSLAIACVFFVLIRQFNTVLTHNPSVTPRSLFFAGDHWGFGAGVGFYGQHTLAAGLVNLDELLTVLAIDLYGWPFYLTLAFLVLPFLTRRATATDWFCLVCLIILTGAYVGYFYHGIYLGPRYLFETLPFLLILTARGIMTL
ncbi:MAG TPA: glycosyltransferase family 39 protein, partial [Ktedonobacteraceae bacterium]|nr:glycosyltransferase family 39 protein [Ktedonobacteraceae bacterium]